MSVSHTDRHLNCVAHAQPLFVIAFPTNYLSTFYLPSTQPCNQAFTFFFFTFLMDWRVWMCKKCKTRELKWQSFSSKSHNYQQYLLMYTLLMSKHLLSNARKIYFLSSILQPNIYPLLFLLGMLPIMLISSYRISQTLTDSISPLCYTCFINTTRYLSKYSTPCCCLSALSSSDHRKPICQKL